MCVSVCTRARVCVRVCVFVYVYERLRVFVCACTFVFLYVCVLIHSDFKGVMLQHALLPFLPAYHCPPMIESRGISACSQRTQKRGIHLT